MIGFEVVDKGWGFQKMFLQKNNGLSYSEVKSEYQGILLFQNPA